MPDFISKLKLDSLVNEEKEEAVSLVELLLGEQAAIYSKAKERTKNESVASVKVRSRRDRRKSGRSAKTINKKSTKNAAEVQKMEQLRQAQVRQEKRKKALLDYQLQKNQKKIAPTSNAAGDSQQSKRAKAKQAEKEKNSVIIDPALRPVVLGLVDFVPLFDQEQRLTPAGNSVKVKRAARALGVESLFEIDTSEEMIGELDWINSLISNITQKKAFLDSLDLSNNFSVFNEALSAFELDESTVSEASNTELLYTLIRDYAFSMTSCTPRLLELPDRDFESDKGRRLTTFPDRETNSLRSGFRFPNQISNSVTRSLPSDDKEVNLRYLLAAISRELLLSFNTNSKNLDVPDATQTDARYRKGRASAGFAFCDWAAINPKVQRFSPSRTKTLSNLHGIVAVAPDGRGNVYPFEASNLISDANNEYSAQMALDKLYEEDQPSESSGPYSQIFADWTDAADIIEDALDTEDLEFENSPGYEILELICREVISKCLDALPSAGNGSAGFSDAAQIAFLVRAGASHHTLRWLILYLCFLQDQLSGTAITGEQSNPAALSTVVKKDSNLYSLIDDKPTNSSQVTRFAEVPASTISVFPELDEPEGKNPISIDALSVEQRMEMQQGQNADVNSSINSFFDMSFEEACEMCALGIRNSLAAETKATASDMSDKTAVTLDQLKETLMGLATSNDSIFSELLTLIDSVKSLFRNGCFDELGISYFSGFTAASIHIALISATAKAAYFIIDDLIENEGKMSGVFQTGGALAVTAKSLSTTSKAALTARPFLSPKMAMSWNSAGSNVSKISSGGGSIKFSFAGVGPVRDSLASFLDSDDQDVATLDEVSPVVGRTFAALNEEQNFSNDFISSLKSYLENVSENYKAVINTVTSDIDIELEGTQTLNERIKNGLPLSSDMAKSLVNFTRVYDSSDATYRDIRTRDKAIISSNMSFMASTFQDASFCEADKIKYMVVGIPSGLLDKTQKVPIDLSNVDRETAASSNRDFVVSIEKVDLTRPDLEYKDKDYSFSRNLFINRIDASTEDGLIVNFDTFDSQFSVSEQQESGLSSEVFSEEQINNLKNDFALKLYSDILLDLDFFPDSFPNGVEQRKEVLTGSILLPSLGAVNKDLPTFLSGSNLAFDPDERKVEGFTFYTEGQSRIHADMFKGLDPIAFSLYSYMNTYGTVASAGRKKDSLKFGTIFERVLAIPFDPDSFEVEIESESEEAASTNAKNDKITEAEREVNIGLETSQGVELCNYRVYVTIPDPVSTEDGTR